MGARDISRQLSLGFATSIRACAVRVLGSTWAGCRRHGPSRLGLDKPELLLQRQINGLPHEIPMLHPYI